MAMTEEEHQTFNGLSARVTVLHMVLVELCRRNLNTEDIKKLLSPLDPQAIEDNPELAEPLNDEIAKFRQAVMQPSMGEDQ